MRRRSRADDVQLGFADRLSVNVVSGCRHETHNSRHITASHPYSPLEHDDVVPVR
jgi:hypothetical protein